MQLRAACAGTQTASMQTPECYPFHQEQVNRKGSETLSPPAQKAFVIVQET
jgi:hypothetical protein